MYLCITHRDDITGRYKETHISYISLASRRFCPVPKNESRNPTAHLNVHLFAVHPPPVGSPGCRPAPPGRGWGRGRGRRGCCSSPLARAAALLTVESRHGRTSHVYFATAEKRNADVSMGRVGPISEGQMLRKVEVVADGNWMFCSR